MGENKELIKEIEKLKEEKRELKRLYIDVTKRHDELLQKIYDNNLTFLLDD